jgi:hypothetical protein
VAVGELRLLRTRTHCERPREYSCRMANVSVGEDRLKELLKAALVEVLEERRDLVRDVIEEAIEDMAMVRALEEGEQSPLVSREDVFRLFEPSQ